MDPTLTDQITCRLARFDKAIRNAENPNGTTPDPCRASAPYAEQFRIRSLLESCDDKGPGFSEAVTRFSRLSENLALLRQGGGREHREALLAELRYSVGSFHAELCWQAAGQACPDDNENYSPREIAAILIEELRDDYDLSDIGCLLESLDGMHGRIENLPGERPGIPRVPRNAPGEFSLWRGSPGIREE